MTKELKEKHFDIRTRAWYLNNELIDKKDVDSYLDTLPNDEENFELVMIAEDDIGLGDELTDDEIQAMPAMTEENIDNFDFMDSKADEVGEETVVIDNEAKINEL